MRDEPWNRKIRFVVLFLAVMASSACPLFGATGDQFLDQFEAWKATDVALVETTKTDGLFEVLEAWKGKLSPGDQIYIPELIPAPDAQPLSQYPSVSPLEMNNRVLQQIPRQPDGCVMVLFLTRASDRAHRTRWEPALPGDLMKWSAVWIEDHQLFWFDSFSNPGITLLGDWAPSMSEADLKDLVEHSAQVQQEMQQVLETEHGAQRAQSLRPFVLSDLRMARGTALEELSKTGPPAVAVIEDMLDDASYDSETGMLIWALEKAGGDSVAPFLGILFEREVVFWEATGPSLSKGWWFANARADAPLRERYGIIMRLIEDLKRMRYQGALEPAKRLHALWTSLPQLDKATGSNDLADACQRLITELQRQ